LPPEVVVFGELGLAGEVRTVPGADRRLAEAHRAGFTRALVPASMASAPVAAPPGLTVHGVRTLAEALSLVRSEADARGAPGTMPGWPTVPAAASL
jgi:DNA repair protein RadA/Sms